MNATTVGGLIDYLRQAELIPVENIREIDRVLRLRFDDAQSLVLELARRGWLTNFQAEQLLIPQEEADLVFGPYRLIDRLGEGGVCRVFKAVDHRDGRVVALKVLRSARRHEPEIVLRFKREVAVAVRLDHPHIVKTFDGFLGERVGYLAMELLIGHNLATVVESGGPLTVVKACSYLRQSALGLQHAHEQGLIHRDIKPQNLFRTEAGHVIKVLDLGLVRIKSAGDDGGMAVTSEGATLGTPDYMPPEQARDARRVDTKADVYSLGCVLYFLLTGQPPFPGGQFMQKLFRHQREEPAALARLCPQVPMDLSELARAMLAKQPDQRPDTATVAAELARYCP